MPLAGRSVVVTGGAQGLGAAYVSLLSELGASVVVVDLPGETLDGFVARLCAGGRAVEGFGADVRMADELEAAVDRAVECFGRLDGFVNNAGVQVMGEIDELDETAIRRVIDINLMGTLYGVRAAVRRMRPQGSGAIVNVTSGAQSGMPWLNVYGASKGAIASLTYGVAIDLAPAGIRVNAIAPLGSTAMTAETAKVRRSTNGVPVAGAALPDPSNNAAAVAFLLSDDAAGVTGQIFRIGQEGVALVSHPERVDASMVPGGDWTFDSFRAAYTATLSAHLVPLGNQAGVHRDWSPSG